MYYTMTVAGLQRNLPICPLNENLSIAGFVIFGDQELTVACARELLAKAPEYDYIITAEAKGIPCQVSMEERMGCGIGACLVCVCSLKNKDGSTRYGHVCKDGPVFDSKEVQW